MINFPVYIARRYLFSKKSHNIINIISWISVAGVAIGTIAFITVLSVMNGFDSLIKTLLGTFEPDFKITATTGKSFSLDTKGIDKIRTLDYIDYFSEVIEEQAIIQYGKKQVIATIKGVDRNFKHMTGIDTMIFDGRFHLKQQDTYFAVVGYGIAYKLRIELLGTRPLKIYALNRSGKFSSRPDKAFKTRRIACAGYFSVQNEIDDKFAIVPIDFARQLFNYSNKVTAIEIKLKQGYSDSEKNNFQDELQKMLGGDFTIRNRAQQNELLYKIMQSEKWAIFLILTFILIIASFNVISSLIMLILDKKKDISILRGLGATRKTVYNIFLVEGCLISIGGAIVGLLMGVIICYIQIRFGVISFPHSSLISAYPVELRFGDLTAVFITVSFIGFIAAWFPVRFFTRNYIFSD